MYKCGPVTSPQIMFLEVELTNSCVDCDGEVFPVYEVYPLQSSLYVFLFIWKAKHRNFLTRNLVFLPFLASILLLFLVVLAGSAICHTAFVTHVEDSASITRMIYQRSSV